MSKVHTAQLGEKLFILNGKDPLRYVDLSTNKVHQYKQPTFIHKYTKKLKYYWSKYAR